MALQNARLADPGQKPGHRAAGTAPGRPAGCLATRRADSRIECFDISHTMGEATVASCVVYDGNRMKKAITGASTSATSSPATTTPPCARRSPGATIAWPSGEGMAPDLILIDGGKGQVARLCALADLGLTQLPMIGVAKGENANPGWKR
jgi:excinuclease ABC subunit C